ncbi:MAG: hypothetical protein AAGN64_02435 [Bacteroidota bacterium]
MLTALQAAFVAALAAQLAALPPQAGELVPLTVGPYGGELLGEASVIEIVPALWVDIEQATLEADDESGLSLDGTPRVELIMATRNDASAAAGYSDGHALADWTLRALTASLEAGVVVAQTGSSQRARLEGRIQYRRIARGSRLWVGAFTVPVRLFYDPS